MSDTLKQQLLQAKVKVEELKSEISRLQRERAASRNYETSPEVIRKAVDEYRAGGTSIRKLCAKYNLQRGRLHRATQEFYRKEPTFDRPGNHVYRTTEQIVAGMRLSLQGSKKTTKIAIPHAFSRFQPAGVTGHGVVQKPCDRHLVGL